MKILILLAVTYVCSGGQIEPRADGTNYSEDIVLDNDEINNVDGILPSENAKTIPYSGDETRITEQWSADTVIRADQQQTRKPDKPLGIYTTAPSIVIDGNPVIENSHDKRLNSQELLGSATGIVTRKPSGKKGSHISDIPADELVPAQTGDYTLNSESNTAASTKDVTVRADTEPTTISSTGSQFEDSFTTSESPIISSGEVESVSLDTSVPSESSVKPEETSEEPTKSSQVTITGADSDKRKTSSVTYPITSKVPYKDTPVYPLYPTFPTRPHITKGPLEIKISIPNIFHLSLGDTPDGRRRLGIQAPFFKFDLTKPRLLKVFH